MKKKRRLKKKVIIVLILLLVLIISSLGYYFYKDRQEKLRKLEELRIEKHIKDIKSHYNTDVIVNKKTNIYEKNTSDYNVIGTIEKDSQINLDKTNINKDTKYFKILNTDFYIEYNKVKPIKDKITINDRYKKYLLFNENIKTKNPVTLSKDNKTIYTLNKELDLPIIKKDDNGYYIEYLNDLYFISKDNTSNIYEKINTEEKDAEAIPVTCNHFIYLEGDTSCNEVICHHENQIKEEFNYLRENNYFTLNTTELREWLEGKIRLPEKSILITIDDGARAEKFIPILEEYKVNATLFLISGWYPTSKYASPYMEIASHTHDLHHGGYCPGGQGSPLKCLDKKKLIDDLTLSRKELNNTEAFCYPFYEFNDYSESILKEVGFKMAFIGGMRKVRKGVNPYRIPRISFSNTTTLQEYINYVKP